MRKIIDGKAYDTSTATRIASWDNGYYGSDFHQCSEDLYRTPRGGWFIYGEGGPLSKYAVHHGNSTGGGSEIIPMSADATRRWMEKHDCVKELEEHFGKAEDAGDDSCYNFQVRGIPTELHTRLKAAAETAGKSMNAHILELLKRS